uniref:transposase n=1 Tax=Nocardia araoensis TaxID=228600 RepID=UPI0014613F72
MPPRKRRSYTTEYKVEAAHRVIDSGRTIADVARELGVDAGMLSTWVRDEGRRVEAATMCTLTRQHRQQLPRNGERGGTAARCHPDKHFDTG